MEKPSVSVIVPVHKGGELLGTRALASIAKQTYKDWECIIVDDGSPDNTREVAMRFAQSDPRFRYVHKENGGPASGRNRGVKESRSDLVTFLDHDDEFLPEYLSKMIAELVSRPEVGAMSCACWFIDENGRRSYSLQTITPIWRLAIGSGWIFRKKCFTEYGGWYDESIQSFGEDVDITLRLSQFVSFAVIPEVLRIHYIFIGKDPAAPRSLTGYSERLVPYFEKFFEKNSAIYLREGPEASAWLYAVGGELFTHIGQMERGREMLKKSWSYKRDPAILFYLLASYGGYAFFREASSIKNSIMRFLRTRLLNAAK